VKNKSISQAIISFLILIVLFGCNSSTGDKGSKAFVDCSRSITVGENTIGSLGLAVDDENNFIHIFFPNADNKLIYKNLDLEGNILLEKEFSFPGQLKSPSIALADQNNLHIVYANRLSGGQVWKIWYGLINTKGDFVVEPKQISNDKESVGDFMIASDHNGGALILWGTSGDAGIYLLHVDDAGDQMSEIIKVSPEGKNPSMFISEQNGIYLSWTLNNDLYYANIPLDPIQSVEGMLVGDLEMRNGDGLSGPEIGVSSGWVYILWSIFSHTGLEAGDAKSYFVSFPSSDPKFSISNSIWISPEEEPIYSPYLGSLALSQIAYSPQNPTGVSDIILNPFLAKENGSEMVAAIVVKQNYRMNDQLQIATLVFDQGVYQGYFYVSKSDQISDDPVISIDPSGNLYFIWREGTSGQEIHYATTNPEAMQALDQLNSKDFLNAILEGGTESLIGIAFMPFIGFGWLLPGFIVIGIWKLFKDQESISELKSWIPLIVSVIVYYWTKIATLPTILTYVPFSAWLYIPANWEMILRIGIPILIFIIALCVAYFTSIRFSDSTVMFYITLTFSDAIMTLAIYGVNFLGVF
jgi:hypothetical protein